jgi:hypothetical protein
MTIAGSSSTGTVISHHTTTRCHNPEDSDVTGVTSMNFHSYVFTFHERIPLKIKRKRLLPKPKLYASGFTK